MVMDCVGCFTNTGFRVAVFIDEVQNFVPQSHLLVCLPAAPSDGYRQ